HNKALKQGRSKAAPLSLALGKSQRSECMLCAHCNSENIKRFSVVCEEGTSTENFSATSKPVWNTKPFSPLGKQKMQGTRTVKTELAKRCSPPADPEYGVLYMAAFPGIILGGYF